MSLLTTLIRTCTGGVKCITPLRFMTDKLEHHFRNLWYYFDANLPAEYSRLVCIVIGSGLLLAVGKLTG